MSFRFITLNKALDYKGVIVMKYIYVDYENLNTIERLPKVDGKYFFFIGEDQLKINSNLIHSTNGMDVMWIKINGSGKNALDFHIAYYIAKNDEDKNIEHFILSKDTGFDPLVQHLKQRSIKIKRIESINDLKDKNVKINLNNYEKIIKVLSEMKADSKPKTREKLRSHIKAQLKGLNDKKIDEIIEAMIVRKVISLEKNSSLKYL